MPSLMPWSPFLSTGCRLEPLLSYCCSSLCDSALSRNRHFLSLIAVSRQYVKILYYHQLLLFFVITKVTITVKNHPIFVQLAPASGRLIVLPFCNPLFFLKFGSIAAKTVSSLLLVNWHITNKVDIACLFIIHWTRLHIIINIWIRPFFKLGLTALLPCSKNIPPVLQSVIWIPFTTAAVIYKSSSRRLLFLPPLQISWPLEQKLSHSSARQQRPPMSAPLTPAKPISMDNFSLYSCPRRSSIFVSTLPTPTR